MGSEKDDTMKEITSLCKRRGFIFQNSEIYGGLKGCWDYGPFGVELKRNVQEAWWESTVTWRDDVVGLDSSIPTVFGVITADNIEQAIKRAGTKEGNKGKDAAITAIEMVNLLGSIR